MEVKLVGVDPSLRNFGFAKVTLDLSTMKLKVDDVHLAQTKPADKSTKKVVRQNCTDLEAAKEMQRALVEHTQGAAFAFIEVPVGSQSARAMASYGICVGVISSCPVPIIPVTPTEVKKAGYGVASATKEEMIEWAIAKHPEAPWLRVKKTGEVLGKNEHLADALAAIYAGMKTPEFAAAISMLRQTSLPQ